MSLIESSSVKEPLVWNSKRNSQQIVIVPSHPSSTGIPGSPTSGEYTPGIYYPVRNSITSNSLRFEILLDFVILMYLLSCHPHGLGPSTPGVLCSI